MDNERKDEATSRDQGILALLERIGHSPELARQALADSKVKIAALALNGLPGVTGFWS